MQDNHDQEKDIRKNSCPTVSYMNETPGKSASTTTGLAEHLNHDCQGHRPSAFLKF
jgi:hypothetical protein